MNQSDQINEIAAALSKAQGEMKNAVINKVNPHFRNRYADLTAVIDAAREPLAKHGLAVTQTMAVDVPSMIGEKEIPASMYLRTILTHSSGQWIASVYPLPMQGKPQEIGSALTYARRYSLAAIICNAADEDDDAELATGRNGPAPQKRHEVLPKKDAKDIYARMQTEYQNCADRAELIEWMNNNKERIQTLPLDWQDILRIQCEEMLLAFRQAENVKS